MAIKLRKFSKGQSAEAMEKWAYKVARDYNSEIKGILESGGSKSQILAAMDEEIKKICKQLDKKENREFSEDMVKPKYKPVPKDKISKGMYYHKEWYKDGKLDEERVYRITDVDEKGYKYKDGNGSSYGGLYLLGDDGIYINSNDKFISYISRESGSDTTNNDNIKSSKSDPKYIVIATTPSGGVMEGEDDATIAHAIKWEEFMNTDHGTDDSIKNIVRCYILDNPEKFSTEDFEIDPNDEELSQIKVQFKECKDDNYNLIKEELRSKLLGNK